MYKECNAVRQTKPDCNKQWEDHCNVIVTSSAPIS